MMEFFSSASQLHFCLLSPRCLPRYPSWSAEKEREPIDGTPDGRAGDEVDEVIPTVPASGSNPAHDEQV